MKTRDSRVCVAALRASGSSIVGQVNLLNVAFDKVVVVRYTIDGWATQDEIVASYSHRLFDTEDIDAFNFTIAIPVKLSVSFFFILKMGYCSTKQSDCGLQLNKVLQQMLLIFVGP